MYEQTGHSDSIDNSKKKTILLVEDEALIALAEKEVLEKNGYQVLMVVDGETAVETVKTNLEIDLVLMDINLGDGIDGTEAAELILCDYDLPVVFLSSHTEPEIVERTEKITSYGYIVKNSGDTVLLTSLKMAFRLFETRMQEVEARKREQEKQLALLASEKRFKELSDNISDVFFAFDKSLVYTYWNTASEQLTGIAAGNAIGKSLYQLFPSVKGTEIEKQYLKALNTKEPCSFETVFYPSRNGNEHIFDISCYPGVNGMSVFVKDITERKKITDELEQTKQLLEQTSQMARVGGWENNFVTGEHTWSQVTKEIHEVPSNFVHDLYSGLNFYKEGESRDTISNMVDRAIKTGAPYDVESQIVTGKGNVRWVRTQGNAEMKEGRCERLFGTIQDIADKKKREQEHKNTTQRVQLQRNAIAKLAIDPALSDGKMPEALERITQTIATTLNVGRAGIWKLTENQTGLECLMLYKAQDHSYNRGALLDPAKFPAYFESIKNENRIYADDAQTDPRTKELNDIYLKPHNITSMLDAGIIIAGELAGVVCLEHTGPRRTWHTDEEAFASTIASMTAQLFVNLEHRRIEAERQEYHELLLTVMNTIDSFIYIADMQTYDLIFVNDFGKKTWGEDIQGKPCWKVLQGMDGPCSFCTNDKLLTSDNKPAGIYHWEFQNRINERWYQLRDCAIPWGESSFARLEIATDITELKHTEEELRRQLKEKEIFLSEIHHRIKNNISSIASLLSLQARAVSNPEAKFMLNAAIGRVKSMQKLYERMLLADKYVDVSVGEYIDNIIDSVIELFSSDLLITVQKKYDDFELASTKLFPLGIVVNEIFTNAMKYAFKGRKSGKVYISVNINEDLVALSVQDDGNGLPDNFDINFSNGFGLVLVEMLSKQLKGSFSITSNVGQGTLCFLEFNKN